MRPIQLVTKKDRVFQLTQLCCCICYNFAWLLKGQHVLAYTDWPSSGCLVWVQKDTKCM